MMTAPHATDPAALPGICYYQAPPDALLYARDGKVQIPYGNLQIPLLENDFSALDGTEPSYDAVGRGIYHLLRQNPDLPLAGRYASMLKEGYPHLLAELATNLMMLDKKDVDLPYLDRKINYLKVFALLEPDNHRFPLEIGATYFDKGLTLAAMADTTVLLYRAEMYLRRAFAMQPDDIQTRHQLGEVAYILGRYDEAAGLWENILEQLPAAVADLLARRISQIRAGELTLVPPVDYLQAIGVAIEAYELRDWEEAAAIILDVIDALHQFEEFPLAEINYLLGLCYVKMDIPLYAEQYLRQALQLQPGHAEAEHELRKLGVK
jgi:tetratricopeptide (TPR) repeat protein